MISTNKKVLILVVEDEKIIASTLEEKLLAEGFEVLKAFDGIEGFTVAMNEHPNLILLDLLMPKMDGMNMLRELRKDDWGKTVPVIILTNLSATDEERNKDITKLEPSYYFMKTEKTLEEIVEKSKEILNVNN